MNDLAWSLDDRRIASGGINEQVHLWDSSTGQQLLALEPHGSPIRHIRWSPDGRKLAAVSDDGVIRVWDATEGYELPRRDFWRHLIEPSQWKEYDRLIDEQRWSEAADLLKKMIAAGGPDCLPMYRLALVNLQLDDQAAYRETCKRMLATFAGTEDNSEARSTAWVCALRPGTLEDYRLAITLARQAFERQFNSRTKREAGRACFPETLGVVLFRAGQYEEALRHLQAASERDATKQSPARIAYVLAMTHHRLGHAADAQMWLDRANQEADEELNNTTTPCTWSLRLQLSLFQREARELVGVQTKAGQQSRIDVQRSQQAEKLPEAEQAGKRAVEIAVEIQTGADLSNLAERLMLRETGRLAEARQLLEQAVIHQRAALKLKPWHPTSRRFLGIHLATLTEVQLALGDQGAAARTAEDYARHILLGADHERLVTVAVQACEDLIDHADEGLGSDRHYPQRQGSALAADLLLVKALFQKAIEQAPDDPWQHQIADFLSSAPEGLRDPDLALKLARRAIELKPGDGQRLNRWAGHFTEPATGKAASSGSRSRPMVARTISFWRWPIGNWARRQRPSPGSMALTSGCRATSSDVKIA